MPKLRDLFARAGFQKRIAGGPGLTTPNLPKNYGFDDLANYEQQQRTAFGQDYNKRLLDFRKQYTDDATKRRAALSSSLSNQGQNLFRLQNPEILEDLNSRGVFTSPTAVSQAQAQALKEIELANMDKLNAFDTQSYADENMLRQAGLTGQLQSEQDAMDSALDLRRGQLESRMQNANAAREEQLARDLAKQQSRAGLTNSLIGAGGGILGGMLAGGGGGGGILGGLLGGGGGAAAGGAGAAGAGGAGAAGAGMGAALLPLGLAAGGVLGYQSLSDKGKSMVAPLVNPIKTVKTIGKALKNPKKALSKAFCFVADTLVEMMDGSRKKISELNLGDRTMGGPVISIRVSKTDEGTLYDYKGVKVTAHHAVKEHGRWLRIKDSTYSIPLNERPSVWSIVTADHRIFINGMEFADEAETDFYESLSIEESLERLNQEDFAEVA